MADRDPAAPRIPASPGAPGASLVVKLGGTMLAVALVPLLLAGVFTDRLLGRPLVARHAKILSDLSAGLAGQVGRTLAEEVQALGQLAEDPSLAAALAA